MLKNTFTTSHLEIYLKEKGLTRRTLKEFTVPERITKIGELAFRDCTSLTSIEFAGSMTEIGHAVFYNCSSLSSIKFSKGLSIIGLMAFQDCTSLTSIKLPNSQTEIVFNALWGCNNLKHIVTNQSSDWKHRCQYKSNQNPATSTYL